MTELTTFNGMRILVVEDDRLVAMLLEDMLAELGCKTVGPAARVKEALVMIEQEADALDGATLDVRLQGEAVYPVAEALGARGVPFAFATGYDAGGIDPRFASAPTLSKPYQMRALERVLSGFKSRQSAHS